MIFLLEMGALEAKSSFSLYFVLCESIWSAITNNLEIREYKLLEILCIHNFSYIKFQLTLV